MQLHEQKEKTYSHKCFHNICFLTAFLFECLIVGLRTTELIKFTKKLEDLSAKTKQISPLMIYWKISKIHQTNLQILATEIYKKKNDLGREIMKHIFHLVQKPYDLRNDSILQRRRNFILYFGTESISSLAPKIWEIAPCETKNAKSLDIFKEKIKTLDNR